MRNTFSEELYKNAKAHGFGFLDAPVSGGQAGAEKGALTVMVGGDKEDFDKAKNIIDCYSKKVQLLGPSGSGQLAKMVNQICIAGLVQGLSEAINFGSNAGLKMEDVIEVISKGAAQSWQMENRYKTMIDDKFDFGFAVDWMRKDLKIAMDEAKKNNYNIGLNQVRSRVSKKTSCIIVVHALGQAAEVDKIVSFAKSRNIKVLEDCSQAHGAKLKNKKVGTFGDIAAFSTMYRKASISGATGGIVYSKKLNLLRLATAHADRGKERWKKKDF